MGRHPEELSIEARYGVAAGGALSSNEVSITCGLDDAGVEAVIAKAVSNFDLGALVAQVQAGSAELPAEIDEIALRLGLTREAVIYLLVGLGALEPVDTLAEDGVGMLVGACVADAASSNLGQ